MGDQEFERYLGLLSGMLRLSRGQRESIAQELRDHLEERLAELKAAGVGEEEAVASALEEFGDIASLAREFTGVAGTLRRRSIMRFTVGTLGTVGVAAMFLLSFWPTAPMVREAGAQAPVSPVVAAPATATSGAPSETDSDDVKNAEVYRELAKKIDVQAKDQPLPEVLGSIFKQCGVAWHFDQKSLEQKTINPEELSVTFNLTKVSGETALSIVLRSLGLTYVVDEGAVQVLTEDGALERLTDRVYPVGDLADENGPDGPDASADSLIGLLTAIISPESWDEVGGRGSVQFFQGMLVISQTEAIHRRIGPLLENLRQIGQTPGRETPAPGVVGAALAKKVSWKVSQMPLPEFAALVSKELGINVVIGGAVEVEQKVTLPTGQFTARKALQMCLAPRALSWTNVRGEVLAITPEGDAAITREVRLYNVRDLLTAPGVEVEASDLDYDSLIEVITSSVDPQSWEEVGGMGTVCSFEGMLIVSQTEQTHDRMSELLSRVRSARQKRKLPPPPNPEDLTVKIYRLDGNHLLIPPGAVIETKDPVEENPADRKSGKELVTAIQLMVKPESWQAGGGKGQIFLVPDKQGGVSIVVKQNAARHKEVRELLRTLERESAKLQNTGGGGGGFFGSSNP